jgi:predicted ABC-type ATPase
MGRFSFRGVCPYIGVSGSSAKGEDSTWQTETMVRRCGLSPAPTASAKTSYAREHISAFAGSKSFVNLDEIARGLSPFDPEAERIRAARVALTYLNSVLAQPVSTGLERGKSVTLETTLAGLIHLRLIALARKHGWKVHLLYLAVANEDIALSRIARRVSEG